MYKRVDTYIQVKIVLYLYNIFNKILEKVIRYIVRKKRYRNKKK